MNKDPDYPQHRCVVHSHAHATLCTRRLSRALEEAKRRLTKAQKASHAAEVVAAELKGKGDAEREAARAEVSCDWWAGGLRLGRWVGVKQSPASAPALILQTPATTNTTVDRHAAAAGRSQGGSCPC